MDNLFRNKYRTRSTRLPGRDYSFDGKYFVTICTKNRQMFFGKIINNKIILNNLGRIISDEWKRTEKIRNNIKLDEFIIMPNHLHGILIIDNSMVETPRWGVNSMVETPRWGVSVKDGDETSRGVFNETPQRGFDETPQRGVSTDYNYNKYNKSEWKRGSLGAIINQFKSKCTKIINAKYPNINFAWQARFWEHIIRNEDSLENIRYYIRNNPLNWQKDRNNLENLYM